MHKLIESDIEQMVIERLTDYHYHYIHGPDIAPDGSNPERDSYEDVVLFERLRDAVRRINPTLPPEQLDEALKEVGRIHSPELLTNNETFHRMLTEGIKVSYQKDGHQRGDLVWLIDFNDPENNDFVVANQFTVVEEGVNKRPDLILFVNGLPLVVMELKNAADEKASVRSAFNQLETYKMVIPHLFTYNAFSIISDGLEAKAGTISAGLTRFMAWKSADGKMEASKFTGQIETLINGMLNKKTLLDLIRHFVVFEKTKTEDLETGVVTIKTVKKLAAYHQYYAVNRAIESALRASGYQHRGKKKPNMVMESPESYGVPGVKAQAAGDRKGGVVWHTQGSGKSLSMVFFTGKLVLAMDNPTL